MHAHSVSTDGLFSPWVAGADGCEAGWFVVLWHLDTRAVRRRTVGTIDDLLTLPESPTIIAVDMIVGCPDRGVPGGRSCDWAARDLLGHPRGTSVFSPPAYEALWMESYESAVRRNRATGPEAPGLSKQTYYLFPKLRDVAEEITPPRQEHIKEVHPELSFYAMNGNAPVEESKHTEAGRARRRALLAEHELPYGSTPTAGLTVDDINDAHAACWTARRIHQREAERCPPLTEVPPRNARGIRMEIWR